MGACVYWSTLLHSCIWRVCVPLFVSISLGLRARATVYEASICVFVYAVCMSERECLSYDCLCMSACVY